MVTHHIVTTAVMPTKSSLDGLGAHAVSSGTLIMRIEASPHPNEEGAELRRALTLTGNQLTWKNPTVSIGASGIATLRRVH
jgi:hypothetical protein